MNREEAIDKAMAGSNHAPPMVPFHPMDHAAAISFVGALAALGVLKLDDETARKTAAVVDVLLPQVENLLSARCEPPPEHREKRWHWLRSPEGNIIPSEWLGRAGMVRLQGIDWIFSGEDTRSAERAHHLGWRYVAPCEEPKP